MTVFRSAPVLLALLFAAAPAHAAGDLSAFHVKLEKLYLKSSSGDWVEVPLDAPVESNLLAETPVLVELENDGRVPEGEYVNVKVALSEKVRFAGSEGGKRTREGGFVRLGGTAAKASEMAAMTVSAFEARGAVQDGGEEGLVTQHLDLDYQDRDEVMEIFGKRDFRKPVPVKKGSRLKVSLGLDSRATVRYAHADYFAGIRSEEAVYYLPPSSVSELSLKVDANTGLLTSESLEWTF